MHRLADHQTSADDEHADNPMHLAPATATIESKQQIHRAQGHVRLDPVEPEPEGHEGLDQERARDGRALEVAALAGVVLGQVLDGDVEAREPGQAAAEEEAEAEAVDKGVEAEHKGGHGGRDAEADEVRERVQLLAQQRRLAPPARHLAVHEVEDQPRRHQPERQPHVALVLALALRPADREQHAVDAAERVAERDVVGQVEGPEHGEVVRVPGELVHLLFLGCRLKY
jgi:hypothetical protein